MPGMPGMPAMPGGGLDPAAGGMGGVPMFGPEGRNDLHPDLPDMPDGNMFP